MRTPALAIGWAIWCQHRRGFVGCAAAFLVMAVAYPFVFSWTRSPAALISSTLPLVYVLGVVINSLLVVEEPGSLTSSYPRHRFVFPTKTHTLVFWPLIYGWSIAALLWLATGGLLYRLNGFQTPLLVPALGLAALTVWGQVVSWLPIRTMWVRDIVTILFLGALAAPPVWLAYADLASPELIAFLLVGYAILAYPVAQVAVESDRRGESWRIWPERLARAESANSRALSSRRRPFRSASEAQFWYEWRCHGHALPGAVVLVLVPIMAVLIYTALMVPRQPNPVLFPVLISVLVIMPVTIAGSMGAGAGRFAPLISPKSRQFLTFVAIRPMTSGGLVAAKFRMAAASVLLTWLLIVVVAVLWLAIARDSLGLVTTARTLFRPYANAKGFALLLLSLALLPAVTWKQLTGGFPSSLSGRRWIADGAVFAYMPVVFGLVAGGVFLSSHREMLPWLLGILPDVVVGVALVKGTVAFLTFRLALNRGLINWPTATAMLLLWLAMSACAAACVWLMPARDSLVISTPILILSILAFMPLSRYALATLAFDWSRHR